DFFFFFSSRRRHTRSKRDWSSDVCSSDLILLKLIDVRSGFDAGKDIQLGEPIRPGDTIEVCSTVHEVYEKTGRTGSMIFVVIRYTLTNQRRETVAVVDNRFMHR